MSRKLLRFVLPPAFWLGVWQLAAAAAGSELLLPGPLSVLRALAELAITGPFWLSAGASLLRVLAGLLLGTALGVLLAVLTSAFSWADLLLSPVIRVIRAAPVASFILLILLWVSRSAVPGVVSGLMVLPVVWNAVSQGAAQTDPQLLELSSAYRFGRWKTFRLIYFPSVLPYFSSGFNTAVGLAWKSGVAAEVICRPRLAAGSQIYNAKLTLEIPDLFAWTAVVIALSFALEKLASRLFLRKEARL